MTSIWVSVVAGLVLMIGLTYAIPYAIGSDAYVGAAGAGINAPGVLWVASIGRHAAEFLILICLVAQFFCGMASVTANSRMIYAFSRDGAMPGSQVLAQGEQAHPHANELHLVRGRGRVHPRRAVAVPEQGRTLSRSSPSSPSRSSGSTSPTSFRCCYAGCVGLNFTPGPWQLGKWSPIIGWTCCGVGRRHLLPADAAAVFTRPGSTAGTSLLSLSSRSSGSPVSTGWCQPASGSPVRRCRELQKSSRRSRRNSRRSGRCGCRDVGASVGVNR